MAPPRVPLPQGRGGCDGHGGGGLGGARWKWRAAQGFAAPTGDLSLRRRSPGNRSRFTCAGFNRVRVQAFEVYKQTGKDGQVWEGGDVPAGFND